MPSTDPEVRIVSLPSLTAPPPRHLLHNAALVRVPANSAVWWNELPPLSRPTIATVTIDAVADGDRCDEPPATVVRDTGYLWVPGERGRVPITSTGCNIYVLVTADARRSDASWWSALHARAAQVFNVEMGPVRALFSRLIDDHVMALSRHAAQ